MTRYNNYKKNTDLTPLTSETLYNIIDNTPGLEKLTGKQRAIVANLMYAQKEYGYDQCLKENKI